MNSEDEILLPQVFNPRQGLGFPSYPFVPPEKSPMQVLAESRPDLAADLMARAIDTSVLTNRANNTAAIASQHTGAINTWLQSRRPDESHIRLTSRGSVHREGFFFDRIDDVLTVETKVDIW